MLFLSFAISQSIVLIHMIQCCSWENDGVNFNEDLKIIDK